MGEVQVFDAHHLVPVVTIPAHDNPITAMNFNRTGDKLATASDKGTVIRIFSMPEGNKVPYLLFRLVKIFLNTVSGLLLLLGIRDNSIRKRIHSLYYRVGTTVFNRKINIHVHG